MSAGSTRRPTPRGLIGLTPLKGQGIARDESVERLPLHDYDQLGGVERALIDHMRHPGSPRVCHKLITTSSNPEILKPILETGIAWYQPPGRIRYDPRKFARMAGWLEGQQVRLVHSYNANANAWAFLTCLKAQGIVRLAGERGSSRVVRPPLAWLDRWSQQTARLVIANSRASAYFSHCEYRLPLERIKVVYNGVADVPDANASWVRGALGVPMASRVVGSVGRLVAEKGHHTLVHAAEVVLKAREDVFFVLIGGGPLEAELRSLVQAAGIGDRFIMTGWREDSRVLIRGFDLFVSTSVHEAFGNALVEAALCQKAVIAPAVDGIPEVVRDGETGILIHPTLPVSGPERSKAQAVRRAAIIDGKLCPPRSIDPQVLAHEILRMLDDPGLCGAYGRRGRERARELFTVERYAAELEEIYLGAMVLSDNDVVKG